MAEGVGFEPTVGFPTLDFESSALNRTQPPFQSLDIVELISGCAILGTVVCLQRRRRTRAFNGAMDVTLTDGGIETRRRSLISLFWGLQRYRRALHRGAGEGGGRSRRIGR